MQVHNEEVTRLLQEATSHPAKWRQAAFSAQAVAAEDRLVRAAKKSGWSAQMLQTKKELANLELRDLDATHTTPQGISPMLIEANVEEAHEALREEAKRSAWDRKLLKVKMDMASQEIHGEASARKASVSADVRSKMEAVEAELQQEAQTLGWNRTALLARIAKAEAAVQAEALEEEAALDQPPTATTPGATWQEAVDAETNVSQWRTKVLNVEMENAQAVLETEARVGGWSRQKLLEKMDQANKELRKAQYEEEADIVAQARRLPSWSKKMLNIKVKAAEERLAAEAEHHGWSRKVLSLKIAAAEARIQADSLGQEGPHQDSTPWTKTLVRVQQDASDTADGSAEAMPRLTAYRGKGINIAEAQEQMANAQRQRTGWDQKILAAKMTAAEEVVHQVDSASKQANWGKRLLGAKFDAAREELMQNSTIAEAWSEEQLASRIEMAHQEVLGDTGAELVVQGDNTTYEANDQNGEASEAVVAANITAEEAREGDEEAHVVVDTQSSLSKQRILAKKIRAMRARRGASTPIDGIAVDAAIAPPNMDKSPTCHSTPWGSDATADPQLHGDEAVVGSSSNLPLATEASQHIDSMIDIQDCESVAVAQEDSDRFGGNDVERERSPSPLANAKSELWDWEASRSKLRHNGEDWQTRAKEKAQLLSSKPSSELRAETEYPFRRSTTVTPDTTVPSASDDTTELLRTNPHTDKAPEIFDEAPSDLGCANPTVQSLARSGIMPWEHPSFRPKTEKEYEWGWEGYCEVISQMPPHEASRILQHMDPSLAAAILEKIEPFSMITTDVSREEPTSARDVGYDTSWSVAPTFGSQPYQRMVQIHGRYRGGPSQEHQRDEADEQLAGQYRRRRDALLRREGRGNVAWGVDARPSVTASQHTSQYIKFAQGSPLTSHRHHSSRRQRQPLTSRVPAVLEAGGSRAGKSGSRSYFMGM